MYLCIFQVGAEGQRFCETKTSIYEKIYFNDMPDIIESVSHGADVRQSGH